MVSRTTRVGVLASGTHSLAGMTVDLRTSYRERYDKLRRPAERRERRSVNVVSTIFDAQFTTLLAALIMVFSAPVRSGFATMLISPSSAQWC
ncbi:MAG: hypothetical protein ACLSA6_18215 [Holdemania massiliensis]